MNISTRANYLIAATVLLVCLGASAETKPGNADPAVCSTGKVVGPARGFVPHRCYRPSPALNLNITRNYGPGKGYGQARNYVPGKKRHASGNKFNLDKGFGPGRGYRLG